MGAWGPGIFQCDDALDLVIRLQTANDLGIISSILCKVATSTNPGRDMDFLADEALAAAEILAAAVGSPSPELPGEVETWLANHHITIDKSLMECALTALKRLHSYFQSEDTIANEDRGGEVTYAELHEFYQQTLRSIQDLERRLSSLKSPHTD